MNKFDLSKVFSTVGVVASSATAAAFASTCTDSPSINNVSKGALINRLKRVTGSDGQGLEELSKEELIGILKFEEEKNINSEGKFNQEIDLPTEEEVYKGSNKNGINTFSGEHTVVDGGVPAPASAFEGTSNPQGDKTADSGYGSYSGNHLDYSEGNNYNQQMYPSFAPETPPKVIPASPYAVHAANLESKDVSAKSGTSDNSSDKASKSKNETGSNKSEEMSLLDKSIDLISSGVGVTAKVTAKVGLYVASATVYAVSSMISWGFSSLWSKK